MKRTQNKASEFTLSREKIEALFNAATSIRDRTLLKLLYHCALRRGEAVALDVRDIDFEAKRIHIVSGKGDKERIVPVPPQVLSDLRFLIGGVRVAGPVFLSQKGVGRAIRKQRVNEILSTVGVKAGVTNPNPRRRSINPHLLRSLLCPSLPRRRGVPADTQLHLRALLDQHHRRRVRYAFSGICREGI